MRWQTVSRPGSEVQAVRHVNAEDEGCEVRHEATCLRCMHSPQRPSLAHFFTVDHMEAAGCTFKRDLVLEIKFKPRM